MWTLKNLQISINRAATEINGKWVPSRPINYKYRTFFEKIKEAWCVFNGSADCFTWPEVQ